MIKEIPDGFVDPLLLSSSAYKDRTSLDKRRLLYAHTEPYFDIENEVTELACLKDDQKLLEIGCGTGKFLLRTAKRFPSTELSGLDISSGIFSDAQEEAKIQGLNITFQVGDAQQLQYPSATFDRTVGIHVLHHVQDVHIALAEIARVTKPDGLALLTANSATSRDTFRLLKERAAKLMNREVFNDASKRFCLEDGHKMVSDHFKYTSMVLFESTLSLTESAPYVEYFDSIRDFWQPSPSDQEWSMVLTMVRDYVENQIILNGKFEEKTGFGVILASDSPIPTIQERLYK